MLVCDLQIVTHSRGLSVQYRRLVTAFPFTPLMAPIAAVFVPGSRAVSQAGSYTSYTFGRAIR